MGQQNTGGILVFLSGVRVLSSDTLYKGELPYHTYGGDNSGEMWCVAVSRYERGGRCWSIKWICRNPLALSVQ